jgi:hypothetical protein
VIVTRDREQANAALGRQRDTQLLHDRFCSYLKATKLRSMNHN